MEEKIDKLIEGQIKIQTKLESMEEKTHALVPLSKVYL